MHGSWRSCNCYLTRYHRNHRPVDFESCYFRGWRLELYYYYIYYWLAIRQVTRSNFALSRILIISVTVNPVEIVHGSHYSLLLVKLNEVLNWNISKLFSRIDIVFNKVPEISGVHLNYSRCSFLSFQGSFRRVYTDSYVEFSRHFIWLVYNTYVVLEWHSNT